MLRLCNVSKKYDKVILDDISVSFNNNGFYVISGESGQGKSTLLNVISLLEKHDNGNIIFNEVNLSFMSDVEKELYRGNLFSFIFQEYNLFEYLTVYENLSICKFKNDESIIDILNDLGIAHLKNKKVSLLSGGERQRVSIARALLNDTPILLADEPTANLDAKTAKDIMNILKEISKTKLIIMVSHDVDLINEYADAVYRLEDGKLDTINTLEVNNLEETLVLKKEKLNKRLITKFILNDFRHNLFNTVASTFTLLFFYFVFFVFTALSIVDVNSCYYDYVNNNFINQDIMYVDEIDQKVRLSDEKIIYDICGRESITKFVSCFISVNSYKNCYIQRLYIDENLAYNEIIVTDYIAQCYFNDNNNSCNYVGKNIELLEQEFIIKNVINIDSNYMNEENNRTYVNAVYVSKDFIAKIVDEVSVDFSLTVNNHNFSVYTFLPDSTLNSNEIICPKEIADTVENNKFDIILRDTNSKILFDYKSTSSDDCIYVSNEIYNDLLDISLNSGYTVLIKSISSNEIEELYDNGFVVYTSFYTSYLSINNLKVKYFYMVMLLMVISLLLIVLFTNYFMGIRLEKNARNYFLLKSLGLKKNGNSILYLNILMIILIPFVIQSILVLCFKTGINNLLSISIFPMFKINVLITLLICFLILLCLSMIIYVLYNYRYSKKNLIIILKKI